MRTIWSTSVLAAILLVSWTVHAQQRPETIVAYTPAGKQYALVGTGASVWFGSGTISTLEEDGTLGPEVGRYADNAWAAGPVWVGIAHMVTHRVMFEARVGAGALVFPNDRLVSARLEGNGRAHTGLLLEAEVLGRYVSRSGVTGSLGVNIGSVGLPDDTGALLRASPRLGYLNWGDGFRDFMLFELGYQFPVINGLEPDIQGVRFHPPIRTTWHVLLAAVTWGF